MKFRTGLIIGTAVGYYFGAKAGRERFEQIERMLDRIKRSAPYRQLEHKVSNIAEEGRAKAFDLVDHLVEQHPTAEAPDNDLQKDPAELFADPRLN
ncbi:MAG: YtxH domain-containing protein [Actinobacteria bacterium]|nr:YtxH domain-containing protein [Actinomycetota bacterium]